MRILFITTYFEPDSGAAAVRLSRLARLLAARGHKVTVLTTMPHYPVGQIREGYRGKFTISEEREGLKIVRACLWATPSTRISRRFISQITFMFTAFLRGLFIAQTDVIFIEAQPVFTGLAGRVLSMFKRRPYVLNVSDLWPDHLLSVGMLTEKHPVYRVLRWLVDGNYRRAARIVGISTPLTEGIRQYVTDPEQVVTIHNGVDLRRFHPNVDGAAFRQKYSLGDAKIVAFIGTFATAYDFDLMLEVAKRFEDRADVLFVYIGGGSGQSEALEARLAAGDLSNVRALGWIEHDEIPAAWAVTHLTYMAIRNHALYRRTFPAKIYEAMASGVPIALAIEGAAVETMRESGAGLVVTWEDVDALTNAVKRLLDDDDFYATCSASARAYAEQHYDAEKVAAAYEAILLTAAREKDELIP